MKFRLSKSFTLLEVLIAVAVLSTVIIFIFRSFAASLASTRFAQDISLACYLAEEKLWEIEEAYAAGSKLAESGAQEIQNKNFNWRYEILDIGNPDLKELQLTVSWKENVREKEYLLEFLTYLMPKR